MPHWLTLPAALPLQYGKTVALSVAKEIYDFGAPPPVR
jgi:hypothetical protein